jgi:endo-1,4-beta-xylanase
MNPRLRGRRRVLARTGLIGLLALALAGAGTATSGITDRGKPGRASGPPLRAAALPSRKLIGSAVDTDALANEADYRTVLAREFSSVTAENVMKWQLVEPQQGVTDYAAADELVRFARRNRQSVRGHTLVWHNQLPSWLSEESFSREELAQIMRRHIVDEASHFRGKIDEWDVVNEPFNEDGTPRDTIWRRTLGPDYIAQALRLAHNADPNAKLYLNDFNLESIGPKSNAMYELVRELKARHVPIHGVGFQGHLGIQFGFPGTLAANLQRFADLGVDVAITEADVRMVLPVTDEKLAQQADYYERMVRACLAVRRCVSFTVWGFTDAHSWVPGFFAGQGAATLYDENLNPKPAYFAVRDALLHSRAR